MSKKLILSILLVFMTCAYIFYLPYNEVKKKTIRSIKAEQFAMLEIGARGIEDFFHHFNSLLDHFSKDLEIIDLNDKGKIHLEDFYNNHKAEISAVTRIDALGKIIHTIPYNAQAIGADVSGQEHNAKIMQEHAPIVSDVFISVQGYKTVAYAYPVFKEGIYNGCITILIPFSKLASRYLDGIKIGESGYAWMTSSKGLMLYCPFVGHTEQSLFKIFPNSPDIVEMAENMLKGRQGSTTYTDYTGHEISGKPVIQLATYMPIELPGNFWSVVLATPEAEIFETMNDFKNKWLYIIFLLTCATALITYYMSKALIIVEEEKKRKKTEESLRESEEKYRLLIESANDAIFIAQENKLPFSNKQTEQLLGRTREEIALVPFVDFIHPEDRQMVLERHQRRIQGEELENTYCFRLIKATGDVIWVELNTVFAMWDRKPATLNFLRDITAQKKLEDSLRQSQKMEAIGRLAGGIAHDFNNILTAIIAYTDFGKMKLDQDHPLNADLDGILKAADRAKKLVKQILTFSRQTEQMKGPVALDNVVREALALLRATIPSSIEIRQHYSFRHNIIMADPTQMHQVVMNLCTNASQALEENEGIIEVALENEEFTEKDVAAGLVPAAGMYIKLSVKDNGLGMDPAEAQQVFEPYYTTKDFGKGSGMGLAVVHGIVKGHDGKIILKSEPGQGTVFQTYFPVAHQGDVAIEDEDDILLTGTEHILLVDDEEIITQLIGRYLRELGYQVSEAIDGTSAYAMFTKNPDEFDLVITDQTMPGCTGAELVEKILALRPGIPIIITTGYSSSLSRQKALDLGARELLMKPMENRELMVLMRSILDSEKNTSAS